MTLGISREERERIDMLLDGATEQELDRKINAQALRSSGIAAYMGMSG